ncbi:hypothetical protein KFK09_009706 [Dendrobium nobile]|uniref:Photolyase/cryptochrome alpha/beta domain-containing protein n=1 Tax=Dendrobium nobile TaxID=94219 RepID=A0A8T3BNE7_DENNO|nr:hypothetical protein KFK09_009706 [Dendrobium nobile]
MMGSQSRTIVWFRRDLRIEDNPALLSAARDGVTLPVFIWCPSEEGKFYPGRCSRWWLKQSLAHLDQSLKSIGAPLVFIRAESTVSALLQCVNAIGATRVVYNHLYGIESLDSCSIEELGLEKESEKPSNALLGRGWSPGWSNADKVLSVFVGENLLNYSKNRMKLEGTTTSLLSPYLHFGEISVRKIFQNVRMRQIQWTKENSDAVESVDFFLRSIGLREYSRYLCFNFPFTHEMSLLGNLKHYPWRADQEQFKSWRQGRTGYPLVDAGMRELWATGWMHNRTRVIVASFFVKFLQLPWTWGMKYFWDTLLDADLESDILGWQYISGSLPDGHELIRLDSPEEQGRKFDPDGAYIRSWIPELARMPTEWIHHPWDAPTSILKAAGVDLGSNYPKPIVDINIARGHLDDALSTMWELDRAAKAERFNGAGEVVADNVKMQAFDIPTVVVRREASDITSSLDQRVPSFHNMDTNFNKKRSINLDYVMKKEVEFSNNEKGTVGEEDDLRSTAESSSAKRRSISEAQFSVPLPCYSESDSKNQCEYDAFKPQFFRGSPSTPVQKDNAMEAQYEEADVESCKEGLRSCKRPA